MAVTAKYKKDLQKMIFKLTDGRIDTAALGADDALLMATVDAFKAEKQAINAIRKANIQAMLDAVNADDADLV